jgi:hypothetical protein
MEEANNSEAQQRTQGRSKKKTEWKKESGNSEAQQRT